MSNQPLLNDDFTGDPENVQLQQCIQSCKKLEDEFQKIFEYQERVQKEAEYVKKQSAKGQNVTEMPATRVGEKSQPILTTIKKMRKKSEIDQSMKKLANF